MEGIISIGHICVVATGLPLQIFEKKIANGSRKIPPTKIPPTKIPPTKITPSENYTQRKLHPRKIPPNNRLKGGVYLT